MTPANPLLPASPGAGHAAVPALGFGRGSTFRVWKPHNGTYVLFGVCTGQGHGCSHHVAHERPCTSRAGREPACLQQRRSPRRHSGEKCVCLSKQSFPVSLEEEARPPARREQGSVCLRGRNIPASRPLGLPLWPGRLFTWPGRFPGHFLPARVCLAWKKGSWRSHEGRVFSDRGKVNTTFPRDGPGP